MYWYERNCLTKYEDVRKRSVRDDAGIMWLCFQIPETHKPALFAEGSHQPTDG